MTIQNLFGRDERRWRDQREPEHGRHEVQPGDRPLGAGQQRARQTTRHGIDNVGVHRAAFCRNLVAQSGGGLGIEAKGGSVMCCTRATPSTACAASSWAARTLTPPTT
ncbi:MAG: hypothetical protein U1E77_18805 [Inhella sp.]